MTCQKSLGKNYSVRQWSPKWDVCVSGSAQDNSLGCGKKIFFYIVLISSLSHVFLISVFVYAL